ncbi:hypothetical protein [Myroides sp. DF42-4-2]|uniref:hypothetical protein n=1 Tax=unclassified Myroides TaxID=2642485 RepID=UPI0025752646|nr:hypothetical protein [Myroides sp. DF42-4-2]MDM1408056.1 hypothetical protein [Myroides sp. DF42-4-2]
MLELSKELYQLFSTSDLFTSVVEKRIFPVVAGEGVKYPFSIYNIQQLPASLDGDEYSVGLHTYFSPNKISEAMRFVDSLREFIDDNFIYEGSGIDFIDKDQSIVVSIYFKTIG